MMHMELNRIERYLALRDSLIPLRSIKVRVSLCANFVVHL
jgi:hypothetical protein